MTLAVNIAQGGSNNVTFRNKIINGAMVIDQRNAGASVTPTGDNVYIIDRWIARASQSSKFSIQQNAGSITPPVGFSSYLGVTSLSAYAVNSTDYFQVGQYIEGLNIADLNWGSANAKTVTLSAWVYSSLTGTFGGTIFNYQTATVSYPFSYSIPVANTWTQISITITGPTSGNWPTTNAGSLVALFSFGVGSSLSGTANTWNYSTLYRAPTGATSVVGTSGATFYITGVQLEAGTTASPFEYRQYGTELALCQRYFNKTNPENSTNIGAGCAAGSLYASANAALYYAFPVRMRAAPTVTRGGSQDTFWRSGGSGTDTASLNGGFFTYTNNLAFEIQSLTNPGAVGYPIIYNGQLSISAEL